PRERLRDGCCRLLVGGPRFQHLRPRRWCHIPRLLHHGPRAGVSDGVLPDPRPCPQGARRSRLAFLASPARRVCAEGSDVRRSTGALRAPLTLAPSAELILPRALRGAWSADCSSPRICSPRDTAPALHLRPES